MTFTYSITNTDHSGQSQVTGLLNAGYGFVFTTINFFSDSLPSSCAQPDPEHLLASGAFFPQNNFAGQSVLSFEANITAIGTGTIACFRTWDGNNYGCTSQGTVSLTGGGGDMIVNNRSVIPGDIVVVNSFSLTPNVTLT